MRAHLTLRHVLLAGGSLAVLAALCASPGLLGDRVRAALAGIEGAPAGPLWAAAVCFALTNVCAALAWRATLRSCGTALEVGEAAARYCVGSGVNALAPLHAGSAVRLALFGGRTDGGAWTVGGAAAAVGSIRCVWLGLLVTVGVAAGALPAWPLLALAGAATTFVVVGLGSRRINLSSSAAHLLDAFRELTRSPQDLVAVAGWALAGVAAKVGAGIAVAGALGATHPFRAALLIVPAVELAAVLPVTPGNVGVASAAIALALSAQGVDSKVGLSIGIAFGAVEWLAGLGVGVAGLLALSRTKLGPRRALAATALSAWALAAAFGATVVLPVL